MRAWIDGKSIFVRAFDNEGHPANGLVYSVTIEGQKDAVNMRSQIDPAECLVETAESDIRNDTWCKYLQAITDAENGS